VVAPPGADAGSGSQATAVTRAAICGPAMSGGVRPHPPGRGQPPPPGPAGRRQDSQPRRAPGEQVRENARIAAGDINYLGAARAA
jgi:hypothetical protein